VKIFDQVMKEELDKRFQKITKEAERIKKAKEKAKAKTKAKRSK